MLGAHIFYRMPGAAGEERAFVRRGASLEPVVKLLALRRDPANRKGDENGAV
jgi:hypothetical protein